MDLSRFIEDLASSKPVPGGGAAAAVAAALGAALVEMVCGLEPKHPAIGSKSMELRMRLLELADEDCRAYEEVMAAYKRKLGIQEALKRATEVPLETMKVALEVEELAKQLVEKGNKNAVSDARSAVFLAQAGQKAARENVEINLKSIKDEEWKQRLIRNNGLE